MSGTGITNEQLNREAWKPEGAIATKCRTLIPLPKKVNSRHIDHEMTVLKILKVNGLVLASFLSE